MAANLVMLRHQPPDPGQHTGLIVAGAHAAVLQVSDGDREGRVDPAGRLVGVRLQVLGPGPVRWFDDY